jgi:hypothetical protein
MDYPPFQATSVPCECVFSSAKETDTAKRNWMSPVLMEALQLPKFALKKQRLDFINGWATSEAAMSGKPTSDCDPLGALLTGDSDTVMDDILKNLSTYD